MKMKNTGLQISSDQFFASQRFFLFFILMISMLVSNAQQDPTYSQYLNNPFTINPSYAGINNRFNANIQYRSQWSGVQGHPETFNFNSHVSLVNNKVGFGVMAIQDKLGDNVTTEFSTAYSYKIKLEHNTLFSFGMQFGLMRFTNNYSQLNFQQTNDPYFSTYNVTRFNTGAGAMLKSDRYLIGLSAPRLLPVTINQGGQNIQVYDRTFYLMGSYIIYLNERVRLRPATLLRASDKSRSVDLNMNLQIEDFYSAGIFTRNFNTYGLLLQMIVKHYRFGYAIEVPGSKTAIPFTTNEFMLGISLSAFRFHDQSFSVF